MALKSILEEGRGRGKSGKGVRLHWPCSGLVCSCGRLEGRGLLPEQRASAAKWTAAAVGRKVPSQHACTPVGNDGGAGHQRGHHGHMVT
jgi:hypothetical protein